MNNTPYRVLELNIVLERLAAQTSCEDAAAAARALKPATHLAEVERLLDETDAAYQLMARFGAPSFGGATSVANPLRRAAAGASLSLTELLRIAATLRAIRALADWRRHCEGVSTCLDERFSLLAPNKFLEEAITTAIVSEEEISDHASPALMDIRRKMRAASSRVREQLDKLVRSPVTQKLLQDPIVTIRDGRFVVPVKAEHRGEISGLVHDTSASGATVFMEPMSVVEANNEIKVLEAKEAAEIERIVAELSAQAGSFADSILADYEILTQLNLIFAKAKLAYDMRATRPTLTDDGHLLLRRARHPLIDPKTVVPIDVELGGTFDTLVITGPNTGGKTVTLKTLGLLTLMVMCGLLPPVGDGSSFSVFRHVLADIGDEQSIQQSLSTFSAHVTKQIRIMEAADEHSLVLLDELGAGTDPVEGAALAVAILEHLREKGARIAATTHYAELKAFAITTPGVENGSCEFDVATLRPTYRLLVGIPGRSNAFAISRRLGMDPAVVERAGDLVSGDERRLEDVVDTLEQRRVALEKEWESAAVANREATAAKEAATRQLEQLQRQTEQELEAARAQAKRLVARARHDADALLEELAALRKQKDGRKAADARSALRRRLEDMEREIDPVTVRKAIGYQLPRPLKVGDEVRIVSLDKSAVVLSLPDGDGPVEVQAGIIRTRVPQNDLQLLEKKPAAPKTPGRGSTSGFSRATRAARTELDLRGQTVEEALLETDKLLDDARLSAIGQLTIIHGKGTGALRAAIHDHLRTAPGVKSFRLGVYGEGETGVTIVEME